MTDTYRYQDANGRSVYCVVRHDPKAFTITRPNGKPLTDFPLRTVLYRLPELLAAPSQEMIYIAEGEKDVDRLRSMGLVATTNPGGCRRGWRDDYTASLKGRHLVILPDNDRAGIRHAEAIETKLSGVAKDVAVLRLPRLRRAEDVSDWLDFRSGTRNELLRLTAKARGMAVPLPPENPQPGRRRWLAAVFGSSASPTEKLVMLAVGQYSTAAVADLATLTGLHRVTVQNAIMRLRKLSVLSGDRHGWVPHADRIR
jgi:5S rRNA maturation endonuclease (ribonuclease M5)